MATELDQQSNTEVSSVNDFLTTINSSLSQYRSRIEGEVTSVKKTYATAIYFTIKDLEEDALLNCVVWKNVYDQNGIDIEVGDKIIVTGTPEIYAPRGTFSLKVRTIEYAGEGALKKSYDELKQKLTEEGLLDSERKRSLPNYPKKIGVITSKSGVVIQDFNSNLGRYGFQTTMVDSRVEGKDAIHEILASLETMSKQDIDVLVIMRGGGSWESLQAFNTESVVRAVAKFECPVVSGIGHDTDVTLVELVADIGASTPTAVAEVLNETWDSLIHSLDNAKLQVVNTYKNYLSDITQSLDAQNAFLFRSYDKSLTIHASNLNSLTTNIHNQYRLIEKRINQASTLFQGIAGELKSQLKSIQVKIIDIQTKIPRKFNSFINESQSEIKRVGKTVLTYQNGFTESAERSLYDLEKNIKLSDPSRILKLGYSLSYSNEKLIRSSKDVLVGETITTKVNDGDFISEIKKVT